MKVHEYQAKALLREFGVAVPSGDVADTPAQAKAIAQRLGVRTVVKAQIHAGGRGKGGGIKLADDPAGAEAAATSSISIPPAWDAITTCVPRARSSVIER